MYKRLVRKFHLYQNLLKKNQNLKQKVNSLSEENKELKDKNEKLKNEIDFYRQREKIIKRLSHSPKANSIDYLYIDEIKEFIYNNFIPNIDRMNIYEDEFSLFEDIKKRLFEWEKLVKRPWLQNKTVISLLGKFSSGKTSIINSILGENLLPINVTPTTAIPTYISYALDLKCKMEDSKGDIKEIPVEILKEISHISFRDYPLAFFINCFIVEYNADILEKISLLDTPGYDSLEGIDKKKTEEAVKESDVVFWVIDINEGTVKSDSIKFIKEVIKDKAIYIVINKADTKPITERQKVKMHIENTLIKSAIKPNKCILYTKAKNDEKFRQYNIELINIIQNCKYEKKYDFDFYDYLKDMVGKAYKRLADRLAERKAQLHSFNERNLIDFTTPIEEEEDEYMAYYFEYILNVKDKKEKKKEDRKDIIFRLKEDISKDEKFIETLNELEKELRNKFRIEF